MKTIWLGVIILACIHHGAPETDGPRASGTTDYCQKTWQCESSFIHLMCEFKMNTKTEQCSKIEVQISDKERQDILKLVNEFRNNIAGGVDSAFPDGAKDIRQVSWDYELEKFAEVYGSQCGSSKVPDLDPCAKTERFPGGSRPLWGVIQNGIDDVIIGPQGWTSDIPEPEVIQSYEPVEGEDRVEPNYGRFTMLAWATTYKMGCSIITCTCSPLLADSKKLVCFFGPRSNIRGNPVFISGQACVSCPAGTSCKSKSVWSKLCASEGDPVAMNVLSPAATIHSTGMFRLLTATLLLAKLKQ